MNGNTIVNNASSAIKIPIEECSWELDGANLYIVRAARVVIKKG